MEQIGTINMTCGTSLGPLMHRVAQESITVEMSFEKSFSVWSSCDIPPTEWLDLLSMKKIAVITEDGNGYVKMREDVDKETLEDYPEPCDFGNWITRHIGSFSDDDYNILRTMKKAYSMFTTRVVTMGDDDEVISIKNILNHFEAEDFEWLNTASDELFTEGHDIEEEFCSIVADLPGIIEKRRRFAKCANWLCEQFGYPEAKKKLAKYIASLKEYDNIYNALSRKDKNALDKLLKYYSALDMAAASIGTTLQQYVDEKNAMMDYDLKPVDIQDKYDAGFISPEGEVYAMNGSKAMLIHCFLADLIFEDRGYVEDPNSMGKDFQLMSMGWIKFHDRSILYDGYIARSLGRYSRAGFTPEQMNILCKFFDVVPSNTLYFGIHGTPISKDKFLSMTDEDFEKVFS